jgi:hypothetical protein
VSFRIKSRAHYLLQAAVLVALLIPVTLSAQSDDNSTPLGDIARALRKDKENKDKKAPEPQQQIIDNDNLGKVMEQGEADHLKGRVNFAVAGSSRESRISSPDVTCSLSFNAQGADPVNDASIAQDLPRGELAKLDGPAVMNGDALDLTVYNGTGWNLREITVGLTIVRRADSNTAYYGSARLLPASAAAPAPAEKHADMTVLYHLKGAAAPFSTAVFHQSLGAALTPDQEWHWAIVQAQGLPPRQ